MVLKILPKKSKNMMRLDTDQFSQFLGLRCPKCGEEIDLEVLVNFFQKRKS